MKEYLKHHEWKIIEDQYHPEYNQISESIFSIGNGQFGQRANFEESYTGRTLQGNYIGGVYYPDKTRVGWWKNGYPEYFAKVLNACDWIGIRVIIDQEEIDLHKAVDVHEFYRELNMKDGLLYRSMKITTAKGHTISITSERFCSMANDEIGAISYTIQSHNYSGPIALVSYLDFDVKNSDANYDEKFWDADHQQSSEKGIYVSALTRKTEFLCVASMTHDITFSDGTTPVYYDYGSGAKYAEVFISGDIQSGGSCVYNKYACICSSRNHDTGHIIAHALEQSRKAQQANYNQLREEHKRAWHAIWDTADIIIGDDVAAQQGIRFNIFQLYQTYTGADSRLNIGPKGFTGEKYGGSTYWDTEAYCIPFYLSSTDVSVARNLLVYRHNQLPQAIQNAEKLGFTNGAALYPMVTMNGEECHNEWEITFEEIHRNGAIAYAIYDYVRYTMDTSYLATHGTEVLIGIARFWAQRVNLSEQKQQYVLLGVTGPNEYENNVNNNWYTNFIACWCLEYASKAIDTLKAQYPSDYDRVIRLTSLQDAELAHWHHIRSNMYFPYDTERNVFIQQDGFLDKEIRSVSTLDEGDRPINQKWSWDRILRSCFIKQADVLQGIYFFEDRFTEEEIRSNFEFYEPLTVHESSLSPCVHSILATKLDMEDKAYEMYLRTSRLDLNDYNNDTEDGCHITSMAGTWLAIVRGFAGMSMNDGLLSFTPKLPKQWSSLSFKTNYCGQWIRFSVDHEGYRIDNLSAHDIDLIVDGVLITVSPTMVASA